MKKATRIRNKRASSATGGQDTERQGGKDIDAASSLIDARIKALGDWRGETLARVRALIRQADPAVVETWKWRGVPVWEHAGIICTGETYKTAVKLTFAKGAALADPSKLFNASLDGNTRRAIDILEGAKLNEAALKALIRAAVALNTAKSATSARAGARTTSQEAPPKKSPKKPAQNLAKKPPKKT